MSREDALRWDARYRDGEEVAADPWVVGHARARAPGPALDVGAGIGANALELAALGYDVRGLDISTVARGRCLALAAARGLRLRFDVADLEDAPPLLGPYDVIVNTRCFVRPLCSALAAALAPGGLLLFASFGPSVLVRRPRFRREWTVSAEEAAGIFPGLAVQEAFERDDVVRLAAVRPS